MAQNPLGPPPRVESGSVFDRWMNQLWNRIAVSGQILWTQVIKPTVVKNTFLAGPTTGADAQADFRAIVAADLGTGTANSGTVLHGDLAWRQAASNATAPVFIDFTSGEDGDSLGPPGPPGPQGPAGTGSTGAQGPTGPAIYLTENRARKALWAVLGLRGRKGIRDRPEAQEHRGQMGQLYSLSVMMGKKGQWVQQGLKGNKGILAQLDQQEQRVLKAH